ncbi:Basic helix-loop-helix DNA-binding superfamily protein isoform 1 [Hibiscus syriacus]|uniref:Basic helix-loop-helix DNA-binding superfamily protein isoform 1 n=1 Tax=Hibiscus syriacus TaxID=106335 RepID=A0A6A3AXG4_HIBSY|nr:histone H2A.Z-specific chaperone CHZ1-like [Hibiscus syriacus]KAE8709136.1 Basic helix-loop-helix DNA-binding superfamily protein isoform 1 [Hibiscus syriacus]
MAFRGQGRGRGWGFGGGYFKSEPFVLFPDIELPDVKAVPEEKALVIWNSRLINYWKASPYYIEEHVSKKKQSMDIERFSDWGKPKNTSKRNSLNQVLQLQSHNFPKELIQDSSRVQRSAKKMRWNLDSGLEKLDMFEKFEKDFEDKEGKEKGDGEEDTDEEQGEQSDESYSDDGDYNENEHFDDDEDDYNVQDDGDDEPIY